MPKFPCRTLPAAALIGAIVCACAAGEPAPSRPFPEVPSVLIYESFETGTPTWLDGKIEKTVVQIPGTHSFKLGEADWGRGDKFLWSHIELGTHRAIMPASLDPNLIHIQFMIWADELGELIVKFKGDGDFEDKPRIARLKTWTPIVLKMSDTTGGGKRPGKDNKFNWLEILFKPRDKSKPYPNVFIDDVIITYSDRPAAVLPVLMAAQIKRGAVERSVELNGYRYTMQQQTDLKARLKSINRSHKAKTVLVAAARPAENENLAKGLTSAAAKNKAFGFSYLPAVAPDTTPVSGLDNMRIFLASSLEKNDAETVLLVLSAADASKPGRPSEDVRVLMLRILDEGRIPMVCLPASLPGIAEADKNKITGFNNTITNLCISNNVPVIDTGFAIKGITPPFEGESLSPAALDSLANLAVQAVKHIDSNLFGRK